MIELIGVIIRRWVLGPPGKIAMGSSTAPTHGSREKALTRK
jgi:hypothetical protein